MIDLSSIKKLSDENSDITPSHVNVEIIPDDTNVDADITINVDSEEAKRVRLELLEYEKLSSAISNEFKRLDHAEHHLSTVITYGLDSSTVELIKYDLPDVKLPSVGHLSANGRYFAVIDGIETKIATESLLGVVEKGYEIIKRLLEKIVELLDNIMHRFRKLFTSNLTDIEKMYNRLKQTHLVDMKLKGIKIKAVSFESWDNAASTMRTLEALRTATLMAQFTSDMMDSSKADRIFNSLFTPVALAAATNGTLDPNDARPAITRWILNQMPRKTLADIGITTKNNGEIEISPSIINRQLHRLNGTMESLKWSATNIMNGGIKARGLIEFGTTLPTLYGKTLSTVKSRIVHIEKSMKDRYQPNAIRGLRRDRFRYKTYLLAMEMTNKLMWHISRLSINVAKEWLHVATIASNKGTLK